MAKNSIDCVPVIREMRHEDLDKFCEVICRSWQTAYKGIVDNGYLVTLTPEMWKKNIDGNAAKYILAEIGGKIIGASVFTSSRMESFPDDIELAAIYLLPEYYGKGIGSLLLKYVLAEMKKQGFENCILDVLLDNFRAISFYKKNGFTDTGIKAEVSLGGQNYAYKIMRKDLK